MIQISALFKKISKKVLVKGTKTRASNKLVNDPVYQQAKKMKIKVKSIKPKPVQEN